jgi:hypothetical protein
MDLITRENTKKFVYGFIKEVETRIRNNKTLVEIKNDPELRSKLCLDGMLIDKDGRKCLVASPCKTQKDLCEFFDLNMEGSRSIKRYDLKIYQNQIKFVENIKFAKEVRSIDLIKYRYS